MRISRAIIMTIASVSIGMAGVVLNCTSAYLAASDGMLGFLVLASMVMIATGYLPALKKWQGQQWATRLMNVTMLCFIVYVAFIVGSASS